MARSKSASGKRIQSKKPRIHRTRAFDQEDLDDPAPVPTRSPKISRQKNKCGADGNRTRKRVGSYTHKHKRRNNPELGLFSEFKVEDKIVNYKFHPSKDPELVWASKEETPEIREYSVPLYTHEKIDPLTTINQITKKDMQEQTQMYDFFEENKFTYHRAIDFYKHEYGWTNRLIAGDSLLAMISLVENEGMANKVRMVYFGPPYGIGYNSNFQVSTNKSGSPQDNDENLSKDPEVIKAYNDIWKLHIHSFLRHMRDRLVMAKKMLRDDGSIFVQISDDHAHQVRVLMDEIFGSKNFVSQITFQKTNPTVHLQSVFDLILWYAKDKKTLKPQIKTIYRRKSQQDLDKKYTMLDIGNGKSVPLSKRNEYPNAKQFRPSRLTSQHESKERSKPYVYNGIPYSPGKDKQWRYSKEGMDNLAKAGRIIETGRELNYKIYAEERQLEYISNVWTNIMIGTKTIYHVQTNSKVVERCMMMSTDPGDLVFDPACGSGTTAWVAEKYGRRWITTDVSQVAIELARARLLCSQFEHFQLQTPGCISTGFKYKTHMFVEGKHLAYPKSDGVNQSIVTLYDQPLADKYKHRVTGPFTVEAVSPPTAMSVDETYAKIHPEEHRYQESIIGNKNYQENWRTALYRVGVTGKGRIEFASLDPHKATEFIHAVGTTKDGKRAIVSFGPGYGTMDLRQVERARKEASRIDAEFDIMIFAALQFDPLVVPELMALNKMEALKTEFYAVDVSKDLMLYDLKSPNSQRSASFRIVGSPDIAISKSGDLYTVEVQGFDFMDTSTGEMQSGGTDEIVMWMLDTDYDERSLYPRQIFFPMKDSKEQTMYENLTKSLKSVIDAEAMQRYRGTRSLPFKAGESHTIAVKIIDNAGREVVRVAKLR